MLIGRFAAKPVSPYLKVHFLPVVEAVGLWHAGLIAFQALARQIHSLPLVVPRLLPGLLRRRAVGVCWNGREEKMLQVVEAGIQRRDLPVKEVVSPATTQSHAKSQDEAEHGPVLETGSLIDPLNRLAGVMGRPPNEWIGPSIAFSMGSLKSPCTTSRMPAAMYLLICWPSMAGNWWTWTMMASSAAVLFFSSASRAAMPSASWRVAP